MDKVDYFVIWLYLVPIIKKTNAETLIIKKVLYFKYHISWVKNIDKIY